MKRFIVASDLCQGMCLIRADGGFVSAADRVNDVAAGPSVEVTFDSPEDRILLPLDERVLVDDPSYVSERAGTEWLEAFFMLGADVTRLLGKQPRSGHELAAAVTRMGEVVETYEPAAVARAWRPSTP